MTYEPRVFQKWSRTRIRYFWSTCTLGAYLPKFFKKTKSFSFIFSIRYVTKIDESSESGGNIKFKCNYMNLHYEKYMHNNI